MTPLLPRAPRSMAEAAFSAASPRVLGGLASSSRAAALRVMLILVPVSPSGTGNTFSSLMSCLQASTETAAWITISQKCFASILSLID